jgi:hypothetical protein
MVGTIRSKMPVELVGYEDEEAGISVGDNRSTWLLSCEVHEILRKKLNLHIKG